MAQWHEHLPRPQHLRRYILTHDRVATAKALFVPQPLEDPMRRVTLFLVNAAVAFKNGGYSRRDEFAKRALLRITIPSD